MLISRRRKGRVFGPATGAEGEPHGTGQFHGEISKTGPDDKIAAEASGIAGVAEHEVQYKAKIGHNELMKVRSGTHNSRIEHSSWSKWFRRMSSVERARLAVYYSSAT